MIVPLLTRYDDVPMKVASGVPARHLADIGSIKERVGPIFEEESET
ncbi:MAG: hypothetical protein ACREIH_02770 [Nitrospiraceae bacterium]